MPEDTDCKTETTGRYDGHYVAHIAAACARNARRTLVRPVLAQAAPLASLKLHANKTTIVLLATVATISVAEIVRLDWARRISIMNVSS